MAIVRVYNDNTHTYKEKYLGKWLEIPPKAYIEMDHNEASHFLGIMPPNIEVDANGIQKPESYKMLRIQTNLQREIMEIESAKIAKWKCNSCGEDLHTEEQYEQHVQERHLAQLVDDDARDKLTKKRGRPPKVVTDDSNGNRERG